MSTKLLMKEWLSKLKPLGFCADHSRAVRRFGILEQAVAFQRSRRAEPNCIRVNLTIAIRDDFLNPPDFVICLSGHVAPRRAGFAEYDAWWDERQLMSAGLDSLLQYGLPWFHNFAETADTLSQWLRRGIEEKASIEDLNEAAENAHPEIQDWISKQMSAVPSKAPRNYFKFLSLLEFAHGGTAAACEYAWKYLATCEDLKGVFLEEPERTMRQLKRMGCRELERLR